jgi:acyl-CoA synthetase (AMP-forming)/AMP-acid ligase II
MASTVIDAGDGLPLTIGALARHQARVHGDRILVAVDNDRISFKEADARSRVLARGLLAAGAMKGTNVALLYPNGVDFLVGLLAAARIGAVAMPFSTLSTPDELRGLMVNSDAAFLLAAPEFRSRKYPEVLQAAFPDLDLSKPPPLISTKAPWLKRIFFNGPAPAGRDPGWSIAALEQMASQVDEKMLDAVEARVSPADRFVMIHTSGSTSTPKGVIHTHGALIRHIHNMNEARDFGSDRIIFTTAPWFWVAGFGFNLMASLVAGGRAVASNATEPRDILDVLEREQVNTTNGYGRTVARLAADPSFAHRNLACIRHGNLYPIITAELRPRDPSLRHDTYGMSETASGLTFWNDETDQPEKYRGSCGKFLPGFEAKIVDVDSGREMAAGEPGELWIRGPFIMEGYYGRPRSTVFDADGWWHTGDVGIIDAEGFFYLKGRLGDMIKSAGANVSPREVGMVLSDLAGGTQSIVLGVPDPERGTAVAAILVTDEAIDEAGLKKQLAQKLSSYKVPRRILRMSTPEIPTLSSGKYDMRKLTEIIQSRW